MNSYISFPEVTKFQPSIIDNTVKKINESVISIRSLDPKEVTENQFLKINSMFQEMWSSEN